MYQLHFLLPDDPHPQETLLQMDSDQRLIYDIFSRLLPMAVDSKPR